MTRTAKEQVNSGLRLASGIVLFAICLVLVAHGLDSVSPAFLEQGISSSRIGWVELAMAALLIPATMHLWVQFFAGCSLFACLNAIWVMFTGRGLHVLHRFYSRSEALEIGFFFATALIWSTRFAKRSPTIADRIAITILSSL